MNEKVYIVDNENNENSIELFMQELNRRKRYDKEEEGLQATGIIRVDGVSAFKINENDGLEPHMFEEVNLERFLRELNAISKEEFLGPGGFNKIIESKKKCPGACYLRITASPNELVIAFTCSKTLNESQFSVIEQIITSAMNFEHCYEQVNIGISDESGIIVPFTYYGENALTLEDIKRTITIRRAATKMKKRRWLLRK